MCSLRAHYLKKISKSPIPAEPRHIKILTQGPLFSLQRFKTIVEFQTGKYDSLIHKRSYQFPDIQKFKIDYHETLFEGEKKFKSGGLQLSWDTPSSCTAIEVDVRGGSYYLVFLKGNSIVGSLPETGLSAFENIELDEGNNSLSVPWKISRRGYNSICVIPMDQNATYSLLNMRLKKQKQSP